MACTAQGEDIFLGGDTLLGNENRANPRSRTSKSYMPNLSKALTLPPKLGGKTDFIEIDGMPPIEATSSDWSDKLICKAGPERGMLCAKVPVHFDFNNPNGSMSWGPAAQGAIVVVIRGILAFDEMAHNAAEAGAVGLIIVDNEAKWKNNYSLTTDTLRPPPIPAVLVAQHHSQFMCSGCNGAKAQIIRRKSKLTGTQIGMNVIKSFSPF
jgi:hypothetical protein